MKKISLLKKLIVCGTALLLSISPTSISNAAITNTSTSPYEYYHQITYEVSILPIDEIDEIITEFKPKEISWVVCNSELEHIEVMKNVKTNKWKVVVYAQQVVIEQYEK